ncbi:MAG: D-alanine--D-alanine ligase [Flavobacteriaceae bacterium]|nr:MAG: D-alanine--D-alanine ligase [Flavobacteriaceae bacterium]
MKQNIAIVMGGYSSEVEISLKSGEVAYNALKNTDFTPYKIHILKEKWVLVDDKKEEFLINKDDFTAMVAGKKITFSCVFNAIHGTPGEDGKLLAYFELINLPHTSAPFYQMAITFNKRDCLSIVKPYGIKTAISYYLDLGEEIDTKAIVKKVGLPCFVKPNNAGSSYGISKVYKEELLVAAIEKAYKEDSQILIEEFLDGREMSVGVIEYQGKIKVLPITEIISENDFFDYEAKYEGKSNEVTPANITAIVEKRVQTVAKLAYKSLHMSGFSRSEYILINDEPHFLEMNTVPGLTDASLLPQQSIAAGISLEALFSNAIHMALK